MLIVKNPIGFRLIRNIIMVSTFFSIIATGIQLYSEYVSEIDLIEQRLEQVKDSSLEGLSHTLWQNNVELIDIQLASLLSFSDITYVSIQEEASEIGKSGLHQFGYKMTDDAIIKTYPLEFMYNGDVHRLGELTLQSHLKQLRSKILDKAFLIVLTQGAKTFIVAFIILYIFSYMVTRHLYKVVEYAHELSKKSNYEKELTLERSVKDDELSLLETALNTLHISMRKSLKRSHEETKSLHDLNSVLEKRVEILDDPDFYVTLKKSEIQDLENIINMMNDTSKDYNLDEMKSDIHSLNILMQRLLKK